MTPSLSSAPIGSSSAHNKATATPRTLLTIGGALWIAYYAVEIAMGISTGRIQLDTPLGLLETLCFSSAIVGLCAGLFGLANSLPSRRGALAITGQTFAVIAAVGAIIGCVNAFAFLKQPGIWGASGVIGSCLSAVFVALAARKARVWPSRCSTLLLLIGLLTFPSICAFGIPADKWVPAFFTDNLPFALTGAAYIAFARMIARADA